MYMLIILRILNILNNGIILPKYSMTVLRIKKQKLFVTISSSNQYMLYYFRHNL